MTDQLTLIEAPPDWRISEDVREAGRRGIAKARAALDAAESHSHATDSRSNASGTAAGVRPGRHRHAA
jgi:hypothetical protein